MLDALLLLTSVAVTLLTVGCVYMLIRNERVYKTRIRWLTQIFSLRGQQSYQEMIDYFESIDYEDMVKDIFVSVREYDRRFQKKLTDAQRGN